MATLDVFRPTVGAAALGFARRALDEALARATSRQLFGGPLAELQLIQAKLADMALAVDAAALLVYRAAWAKDAGRRAHHPRGRDGQALRDRGRAARDRRRRPDPRRARRGRRPPVERLYREIRALRIYEGASEVQKLVIARQMLAAHAKERAQGA